MKAADLLPMTHIADVEGHTERVQCMIEVSANSVWSCSTSGCIVVHSKRGETTSKFQVPSGALTVDYACCLCAVEDRVWAGLSNGFIVVYDAAEPLQGAVAEFEAHKGPVTCLVFSARKSLVWSGGGDAQIVAWNMEAYTEARRCLGHQDWVRDLLVCNGRLWSASDDGTTRLYDEFSGRETCCLRVHQSGVLCLTRVGDQVWSGGADRSIYRMDLTGKELGHLVGNKGRVLSLASSASLVWSGASDKRCLVWSARNPRLLQAVAAFGGLVTSILCVDKWVMWIGTGNGAIRCYLSEPPAANAVFPASKAALEALFASEAARAESERQERLAKEALQQEQELQLQRLAEEENQRKAARKREKEAAALEELERAERAERDRVAELERQAEEERQHQIELKKQQLEQTRQAQLLEAEQLEEERHQQEMQRKKQQMKLEEETQMRRQQQQQQLQEAQHQMEMQKLQQQHQQASSMPRPNLAAAAPSSPYAYGGGGGMAHSTPSYTPQQAFSAPPSPYYPQHSGYYGMAAPSPSPSIIMMPPQQQQQQQPPHHSAPQVVYAGQHDGGALVAHLKESNYMLRAQLLACQEALNSARASHAREAAAAEDRSSRELRAAKQQYQDEGRRSVDEARAQRLEADSLRAQLTRVQDELRESKATVHQLEMSLSQRSQQQLPAASVSHRTDYRALREEMQQSSEAMRELKMLNAQIRRQLNDMSNK